MIAPRLAGGVLGSLKALAAALAVAVADWALAGLALPHDASFEQVAAKLVEWALIGAAVWLVPNLERG